MALLKDLSYHRTPNSESADSRSLLRTVRPEIRTFARAGVLREVYSAIILFRRWIRSKCLSWFCDVTRGLSFLLPVCRRRIISFEIVILDTLKWYVTPGESFQPEPYPPLALCHFDGAVASTLLFNFVDSTINDRMGFKCLIRSSQTQSWDGKLTFLNFSVTKQDVIVYFVRINAFHANIDVNDNKQLFWF